MNEIKAPADLKPGDRLPITNHPTVTVVAIRLRGRRVLVEVDREPHPGVGTTIDYSANEIVAVQEGEHRG